MRSLLALLLLLPGAVPLDAQTPAQPAPLAAPARADAVRGWLAMENLHAWCVVPFDAKKRTPGERAAMLQKLGFKRFAYDWRPVHVPTFEAEVVALKERGIELVAWWSPTNPEDPLLPKILEIFKRQGVHPQLWLMGAGEPTHGAEEQALRVDQEAGRVARIATRAKSFGCSVALYNHHGWFCQPDNQLAVLARLRELGAPPVGMVYNFSHSHADLDDFPAIWKRIQPHVVAVNITGVVRGGEHKYMPPSQGDFELGMLQVVLESGWRGPVGLIAEQGGDAEQTLSNNLRGLEWLKKELVEPGSGGPKPVFVAPTPAR